MATVGADLTLSAMKYWAGAEHARLAHLTDKRTDCATAQDAQRVIQRELEAVHLAACSMRRRYNALAPVSRLPTEILTRIFVSCATADPDSLAGMTLPGRLPVTHVCHHWRIVALECCGLWSDIFFDLGIDWTKEALRRARGVPIDLYVSHLPETLNNEQLELLSSIVPLHLHHIRQLSATGDGATMEHIASLLCSSAPVLEEMALVGVELVDLGVNLFASYAPRLQTLSLSRVTISWSTLSVFASITTLTLSSDITHEVNLAPGPSSRTKYDAFLCALTALGSLETLVLNYIIPSPPSIDFHSANFPVVSLPKLKQLSIDADIIQFVVTMRHLVIPDITRCTGMDIAFERDSGYGYDRIIPWLTAKARHLPPIRSMSLMESDWGIILDIWEECSPSDIGASNNSVQINNGLPTFSIHFIQIGISDALDELRAICSALDLGSLRRLDLSSEMRRSPQTWVEIFQPCSKLTHLQLRGDSAASLCTSLREQVEDITTDGGSRLLFPSLEFIGLSHCHLEQDIRSGQQSWNCLWDVLEVRRQTAPAKVLALEMCRVTPQTVRRLSSVVEQVLWDKDVSQFYDSDSGGEDEDSEDST